MASGFALGAITAAGVAAGAVTFGIAPALGLVVGIGLSKTFGEYHYQSASNTLRRILKNQGGVDRNVLPIDNLPEAIAKVIKKYTRVSRRGKMLLGGARGVAYNIRHLKTTFRAWRTRDIAGDVLTSTFVDDHELKRRLLEFRYYGQMTYNTVSVRLDQIVALQNQHLEKAQLYYAHILRQVHFTGKHERCGRTCYNIPVEEFRANVRRLGLSVRRGNFATSWHHARTDAEAARTAALAIRQQHNIITFAEAANEPAQLKNTEHLKLRLTPPPAPAQPVGPNAWGAVKDEAEDFFLSGLPASVAGDMASASADVAQGGFDNWSSNLLQSQAAASADPQQVTYTSFKSTSGEHSVQSVPFSATAGSAIGVGLDLAIDFIKTRYKRRQVRNRTLGALSAIQDLLESNDAAAFDEFMNNTKLEKADMSRLAEKILWYGKKIHDLEDKQSFKDMQIVLDNRDFELSSFPTCGDAYNLWWGLQYLLRQYGKIIANLVCLEVLLLKLDAKLVNLGIGVTPGTLIGENNPTPPRPLHMKDIDD